MVNRAVVVDSNGQLLLADKDIADRRLQLVGVTKQSGTIGQLVEVVKFGTLTGASLGAVSDRLFLGNNGNLLSIAPTTGAWVEVGKQTGASEFHVDIQQSVIFN